MGFLDGSAGRECASNAEDTGNMDLIPMLERSLGGGYGNLVQYSCLENPMVRGAWRATIHKVAESDTTETTEHIPLYTYTTMCLSTAYSSVNRHTVLGCYK